MYENKCICGTKYDNNCAHYLANWMIEDLGLFSVKNAGAANCPTGRPIRAKEMASVPGEKKFPGVFESVLGLTKHKSPPAGGGDCYIYCEYTKDDRGKTGQGHVYYGTKENSTAGTGSGTDFGMSYYQYYY